MFRKIWCFVTLVFAFQFDLSQEKEIGMAQDFELYVLPRS